MTDSPVETIHSEALASLPHAFLGRRGGVSEGIFAGLNVGWGSDDDRDAIIENRRRVVAAVKPGATLVTVHQVHSPTAVLAVPGPEEDRPKADALVTDRPDVLIGILTADCVPVLLADAQAGVVGAAHSGWKSAIGGVIASTVEAMEKLGADRSRIAAAVGPCIGRASYEVDDAFLARFCTDDPENERFFLAGRRAGHHQFDIEAYAVSRLALAGVRRIEALGLDTYADEERFFSYRRTTHRSEPNYGRQISVIGLLG
jgi:YfiH family protein